MLASALRHRRFQLRVHRRQGLLALAHGEPIFDALTLAVLRREGLIRADGVATDEGRALAAKALRDEAALAGGPRDLSGRSRSPGATTG